MGGQPAGEPNLLLPAKYLLGVARKIDIVWGVSVDEIGRRQGDRLEIHCDERPSREYLLVVTEITKVVDGLKGTERDIETPFLVEPTQPIKSSLVQVVEERSRFGRFRVSAPEE